MLEQVIKDLICKKMYKSTKENLTSIQGLLLNTVLFLKDDYTVIGTHCVNINKLIVSMLI